MTTRILRSPGAPFGYLSFLAGIVGFAAVAIVGHHWVIGAGLLVVLFACGIRTCREAVVLDGGGLTIRNLLRSYRLCWSDLRAVEVQRTNSLLRELWPFAVASVVTRDGRRIRLGVTRVQYQTAATAAEKGETIREAWKAGLPQG
ncbi:MAG: PH domain-containing protein [Actinomycetota bacterium]|nr:PH domain-containing protein [Actinomycetota bacterium]